jgi:hypothetical protein
MIVEDFGRLMADDKGRMAMSARYVPQYGQIKEACSSQISFLGNLLFFSTVNKASDGTGEAYSETMITRSETAVWLKL